VLDLDAIRARAATVAEYRRECWHRTYPTAWFGVMALGGPELEADVLALADEVERLNELVERLRPMGDFVAKEADHGSDDERGCDSGTH
jgi:hypothetical protein